jgi:hypothetical protein
VLAASTTQAATNTKEFVADQSVVAVVGCR